MILVIALSILTAMIFNIEAHHDFKQARRTARFAAEAISEYKNRAGAWPESLASLPEERRPPASVAGFFIRYTFSDDTPHLTVGRRDWIATWNWRDNRWSEFF
ncbi:MAG: hypothetical protein GY859_02875 [Desulfobacterales bacterium]|nr:hypothetical protein [Desulfobacterales bacterium]